MPFTLIFSIITSFRNRLYNNGFLISERFEIPLISVGNLAVGGTGKTPHVEFILNILHQKFRTAMLSRGYKRDTTGFILASENAKSCTIGDEPFQIYRKFPDCVIVVDEKRVRAVNKLINFEPKISAIVLDDAFQHRQISAGLSILLTCYNHLYTKDSHLPGGDLREHKVNAQRADLIIVTKCPPEIQPEEIKKIGAELKPGSQQKLFFSSYEYNEIQPVFPELCDEILTLNQIKKNKSGILLITGIVSPEPILGKLKEYTERTDHIFYGDHHVFNANDFVLIEKKFKNINANKKIIIVTEKDAARLVGNSSIPEILKSKIYFLPVKVKILNNKEPEFIKIITDYVTKNSRNY